MTASATPDDPRIAAGMAAQLAERRRRIAAGETPIGWKVGFGSSAAMEKLAIAAPLVGFMTSAGRMPSGACVSLAGWAQPVAEPEVAVLIGQDLAGGADEAAAAAAIAALAPAIELADLNLDPGPEQVEGILRGDVFHRHVIIGEPDPTRAGGSVTGLSTRVVRNGEETARQPAIEANTGGVVAIVRIVADTVARAGERLKAGDFVIAGSITPPLFLGAQDHEIVHELDGLGSVSVRFAGA